MADGTREAGVFDETGPGTGAYALRHWNVLHPSGTPVGRAEAGGKGGLLYRYYYSDHLGSVRTVVSSGGTTLETRDYYPYGLEMPGRVSVMGPKGPEGYTGHELDAETAMNYAGARFYMPLLGRWTTTEPYLSTVKPRELLAVHDGSMLTTSPYNYVFNNPVKTIDPDGRCPGGCVGEAAAAVVITGVAVAATVVHTHQYATNPAYRQAQQSFWGGLADGVADATTEIFNSAEEAISVLFAEDAAAEIAQAEKGIRSLERRIAEHEEKLDDYQRDPEANDNQGRLREARTPEERDRIIRGRVRKLQKEIRKFKKVIEQLKERVKELKEEG